MIDKFKRSWSLVKASAAVLRSDKELAVFPLVSVAASLLVVATFMVPMFGWRVVEHGWGASSLVWAYLFYFCQYTVIVFCNAALVGAAMIRLEGGDPTLRDGFAIAWSRIGAILGYAAIAATVGLLLQWMKERGDGLAVRLLGSGLGAAWTLATFLVVPVLVSRNVGPLDALRHSATMLRRTWGENVIGSAGIGLAFGLLTGAVVLAGVLLVMLVAQASTVLAIWLGGLFVVGVALLGVYQSALSGVYAAALYRYAANGEVSQGFEFAQIEQAFAVKN